MGRKASAWPGKEAKQAGRLLRRLVLVCSNSVSAESSTNKREYWVLSRERELGDRKEEGLPASTPQARWQINAANASYQNTDKIRGFETAFAY